MPRYTALISRPVVLMCSVALVTGACGRAPQAHTFRVIEENGIPLALTTGGPRYDDPPFRLEMLVSIHQKEEVPASLLSAPSDFCPGPDRTLIVIEGGQGRAVVYDAQGEFIREIGSKGSGPGQFQLMGNLQVVGDTLAFYDRQLLRLTLFDREGKLQEVIPTRDYGSVHGIDYLPGGLIALMDLSFRFDEQRIYHSEKVCVVHRATGDTLSDLATDYVLFGEIKASVGGMPFASEGIPFLARPTARVISGSRILLSSGDRSEIDLYDLTGHPLRRIRLDLPARLVTSAMKDVFWETEEKRLAFFGETVDPKRKANKYFPEKAGWWCGTIVDDAGYLWMEDAISVPGGDGPCRFLVIDPEGRYLGDVDLPATTGRIVDGCLYVIVQNPETGSEEPTVFRIVPSVGEVTYP